MPIHDWTRVRDGQFHFFHQQWIARLCQVFNSGGLPAGYYALSDQNAHGPIPDVLTLQVEPKADGQRLGVAVADAPPQARIIQRRRHAIPFAQRAKRVSIRLDDGQVVAVIEIVSAGNKHDRDATRTFVNKSVRYLRRGIQLVVVDLFPHGTFDPRGLHARIWRRIERDRAPAPIPENKPLAAVSYTTGEEIVAYVEPLAVGDALPNLPLFLTRDRYIPCPLESTYQETWSYFPAPLKGALTADAES